MRTIACKTKIDFIISEYMKEIKNILGKDIEKAMVYGSFARGEYGEDSDIDIAIFTARKAEDFYLLINNISEVTFEYNVRYDVILTPVFQNSTDFYRMIKVVPYFQSIQKEGVLVG